MRVLIVHILVLLGWMVSAPLHLLHAEEQVVTQDGATDAAAGNLPPEMRDIRITEKLGSQVDIEKLQFTNEKGEKVFLKEYFHAERPVVFLLVYYKCPGLCNYLLNGFTESVRTLDFSVGKEFDIVTVSINPKEGPDLAAGKKAAYSRTYGRDGAEQGWHWLVGEEPQIQSLASQLGFGYRLDEASGEYAHSAGIFVLTPEGKISRVLYGIDFRNRDLKLALMEASRGKIGSFADQILMFCYHYEPGSRGYAVHALRLVQAGGLLTILILGLWIYFFVASNRSKKKGLELRS